MRRMRLILPLVFVVASLPWWHGGRVVAQTTEPSDATVAAAQWNATCREFVQVLASGNSAGVASMLAGGARITGFSAAGQTPQSLTALAGCLSGQTVISQHGYLSPASTMAGDISSDFAACAAMPTSAVARMSFTSDADQKHAGDTAAKWLSQTLSAKDGQPVAIVVLWPAGSTSTDTTSTATFIIFSGQQAPADNYQISAIVFGDPLAP